MDDQNLKFLQDLFLYSQKVCSWSITSDMQLFYSNCPEQEFFFNAFLTSSCCAAVQAHFALFRSPLLVSDRTGFVWIAVCGPAKSDKPSLTYLLGPMFTTDTTRTHLSQLCRKMHLSVETTERLGKFIGEVPTVSTNISTSYATALHYCVTGDAVSVDDVEVRIERIDRSEDMAWGDVSWHGSWVMEQRLFKSIMEGRYEDFSKINIGSIGNMGGGDNLRQAKNEIIVFAVLCSRAAILGGVSVEGALSLSDYFIQLVEAADTVPEAVSIGAEMQQTYLQRVRKVKANSNRTALVRSCMEYVETHILEKISLKDMALEVG